MLDEFPLLGRLRFLETNMGAMAGYGLKAYMVCQSPNHIRQTYGRDNVLIDNCQVIAAFGTAEPESAAWISSLAGKVYDKTEQVSKRRSLKAFDDGVTVTSRDEERALISAKDIQTLADTDQLIFVQGHKPLRAQKLAYDREPVFQNRLCPFTVNKAGLTTAHDWEGVRALGRCPPPPRAKRQGKAPSPDQDPLPFGQETESEVASAAPASTQPEPQPGPASATDVAATPELAEADVGEAKIRPRRRRPKLGGEG
jgi:type IV secretion system protein VirD4